MTKREIMKLREANKRLMEANRRLRVEAEPPGDDPWVEKVLKHIGDQDQFSTEWMLKKLGVPVAQLNNTIEEGRRLKLVMQHVIKLTGQNWRPDTNVSVRDLEYGGFKMVRGWRRWNDGYVPKKRLRRNMRF